ncbi:hypothetical protein HXZ94_07295 [Empedobacter falsenii]|uniref:DUF7716 domain-containing protein n=1 Tax=Empedobacter falsenii TaxID=343874 RepID=UPI0025772DDD|nr:hypothetical protein [Empedobacter falsenii]MDM1298305.1 hypothetical protein [Empedobacter falsenii]MDM1318138.1 hypothetical protein [Empedobacter falsenii]
MADFKNKHYQIEEFFNLVKNKQERPEHYDPSFIYSIYTKTESLELGDQIYIGDTSNFDDNDNEIFPDFVVNNGYEYYCSDENIQDVIDLALRNNPNYSDAELLQRLKYYLEKDTFLD